MEEEEGRGGGKALSEPLGESKHNLSPFKKQKKTNDKCLSPPLKYVLSNTFVGPTNVASVNLVIGCSKVFFSLF